jgi:hypothetical protein
MMQSAGFIVENHENLVSCKGPFMDLSKHLNHRTSGLMRQLNNSV